MKTKYLFPVFVMFITSLFAQNEGFHYKFLITDNNNPMANQPVNIKFTVKDGSTVVWEEEHPGITTDGNGIATVVMGEGSRLSGTAANFNDIDWSLPLTYDVDINTGSGYINFVSGQAFKFVPKAKYAETADFNKLQNKPVTFYVNGTTDYPTDINDHIYHLGQVGIGANVPTLNTKFYVINSDTGIQTGQSVTMDINAGDNANKTAFKTYVGPTGSGYLLGISNHIQSDGSGTHIAHRNRVDGDGNGTHITLHNVLAGNGGGFQVGEYTQITNSGDNWQYGNYVEINNSGEGVHVGYVSSLHGSGNNWQIGTWNFINNSGTGDHMGTLNEMGGTSDATTYGVKNNIYTDGSGDKYGVHSYIDASVGGIHYGVYSEVTKSGSYAGYFVGDVYMENKLMAPGSGNADMKPYIYGSVTFDGNIQTASSTDGFTASQIATGEYQIQFTTPPGTAADYMVITTLHDSSGFGVTAVERHDNYFLVKIADLNGNAINQNFFFVVYKK